jgi:hypothetical protein
MTADMDVEALPAHVYCKEESAYFTMTKELMPLAESCIEDFFKFLIEVLALRHATWRTPVNKMLNAFLLDRKHAYEMKADVELWCKFRNGAVKCPQGYLVYKNESRRWERAYVITNNGNVFAFSRHGEEALEQTIMQAIKNGTPIPDLKKAHPTPEERKMIAAAVGTVNPTLALVFLP